MNHRRHSWLFVCLPALAALCIAIGPAPSAAAARLADILDRQSKEAKNSESESPHKSNQGESDSEDDSGMSGFVAPASAKPAEIYSTTIVAGLAAPFHQSITNENPVSCEFDEARRRLVVTHRRTHLPNAPPLL